MFEAGRKCEVPGERLFPPGNGPYGHATPALRLYECFALCVAYVVLIFDVVNIMFKSTCNDLMLWEILCSQNIKQR